MKDFKFFLKTIIVVLTLAPLSAVAQGSYEATPSNASQTANQIYSDYNVAIDISQNEVDLYLNEVVLPATFCQSCTSPVPEVTQISPQVITLEWQSTPGATNYEISTLNLSSGAKTTTIIQGNLINLNNLPDAMYAISLVSHTSSGAEIETGPANVIILEKPLLMIHDPAEDCPCDNPVTITNFYRQQAQDTYIKFNWNPQLNYSYMLQVNYDTDLGSSVNYKTITGEEGYPFFLDLNCQANLDTITTIDNTLWGPNPDHLFSFYLDPSDYSWTITDENFVVNYASMLLCQGEGGRGPEHKLSATKSNNTLIIYPNPTSDLLTIELDTDSEIIGELKILNTVGQDVYKNSSFSRRDVISVADWAQGPYLIMTTINGNRQSKLISVVK